MRHIHLTDGLRLRFPGRGEEFDQGVEIGALAVLMDIATPNVSRWIATANVEQARALAQKMDYRVAEGASEAGWTYVTLHRGPARPQLRLVHSVA
jgi:hypothetical protein